MARHKHADLMIQAAEHWDEMEWRWKWPDETTWSEWRTISEYAPPFDPRKDYDLRPIRRPLFQKRVEVPRAETEAPKRGQQIFIANPFSRDSYSAMCWFDEGYQIEHLKRGLVYLTAEDAAARGRAMVETEE